jgi:hypothetical protein
MPGADCCRGASRYYHIRWDFTLDNASGADDNAISDARSGKNNRARADQDVVANLDAACFRLALIDNQHIPAAKFLRTANDGHIWRNSYIVADRDVAVAGRQMIKAADGTITSQRYLGFMSLDYCKWLDHRAFSE